MGTTVSLILNGVFAGVLVIGFLIGLWRGLKKASVNLAFSIVGILIAFFLTPVIANSAMTVNITINGQTQTISDFIMSQINSGSDIGMMLENNPSLQTVITKLPFAIVSALVFILLTLIIELVIYIIYKIIAVIFLKNKKGKKRHRLLGGLVGTVRAFLLSVFALMPIASICGMVGDLNNTEDIFLQSSAAQEYNGEKQAPKGLIDRIDGSGQAMNVISSINNCAFFAVGGVFGLDNLTFDYLSSFKVDNETVYLRQEVLAYASTANVVMQLQEGFSGETQVKFSSINFEKLEKYVDQVLDSKLFSKVVCELAADIIQNYKDYSFAESFESVSDILDDIAESLANVENVGKYFTDDIKSVFTAFKALAENGVIDEIQGIEIAEDEESETAFLLEELKVLTSEENAPATAKAFNSILTTNILSACKDAISDFIANSMTEGTVIFELPDIEGEAAWTKELGYLGQMVSQLTEKNDEGKNLLDTIVGSEDPAEALLDLESDKLVAILKPMLYSKLANPIKDMLFDTVNTLAEQFGAEESKLSTDSFVFDEDSDDDQADQVCDIFLSLVKIAKECQRVKDEFSSLDIKEIDVDVIADFFYEIVENPAFDSILDGISAKVEENIPAEYKDEYDSILANAGAKDLAEFVKTQDAAKFKEMFNKYFGQTQSETTEG